MTSHVIGADSKVSLYFSLELENGDLVDSNFDKNPAVLEIGDGSLLPGFEKHLLGMKAGEKKTVVVPRQDAFGARNPQNIQIFKRSDFDKSLELSVGLIVSFADASGGELPGLVNRIEDDTVEVDFNHPLAGRSIVFTFEIVSVDNTL